MLTRALAALDAGDDAAAITALVEAWSRPTMQAPVASLGIIPPWRSWPRPAPVELVRAPDGTYQRV